MIDRAITTTNRTVNPVMTRAIFLACALTLVGVLSGGTPTPVRAQLAHASASTLGLAGNNTATVRGFGAISVNPAGLGMEGSGFSLALAPIQLRSDLGPITLADLAPWSDEIISADTKDLWLQDVNVAGGQTGTGRMEVSGIAFSLGNVGFQQSTVAYGNMSLPPGVVEAILYGNAGRTGSPVELSLVGAGVDAFAVSTAAVSVGVPLTSSGDEWAIGVTGKYMVGHGLVTGRTVSGSAQTDPLSVDLQFPIANTAEDYLGDIDNGNGFGLDVGLMVKRGSLSVGASVQNAISTFAWDPSKLVYRPGLADLEVSTTTTDFQEAPFETAPPVLVERVENMNFKPTLRVGAGLDVGESLTLSADLHNRFSDGGFAIGPKFHLGAGAEYRGLRLLHVRAGAAVVSDGMHYSGGASLVLGPVNLSGAALMRQGDLDEGVSGQITLSFFGR